MDQEYSFPATSTASGINIRLRDLEEKQRLTKERLLLIGQNLIEMREKIEIELGELKKDLDILKSDIRRIKGIIQTLSEETSKLARKEEVAILARQFKMFEPLKTAQIKAVSRKPKTKTKPKEPEIKEHIRKFWEGKV